MRKTVGGLVLAGAIVLGSAGVAGAGEYTGKGGYVPGGDTGKSACSYSGQDVDDGVEDNDPGFDDDDLMIRGVQNYGQHVALGIALPPFLHPGQACRGNAGGGH